jgi:hypothetical protein
VSTRGLTAATRRRGSSTQPTLGLGRVTTSRAVKWISWGRDASAVAKPRAGEDR